jgi:hypothetical protein
MMAGRRSISLLWTRRASSYPPSSGWMIWPLMLTELIEPAAE